MKQITMDWDTYQKEIQDGRDSVEIKTYDNGFKAGEEHAKEKLNPLLDYLKDVSDERTHFHLSDLISFMKQVGEL